MIAINSSNSFPPIPAPSLPQTMSSPRRFQQQGNSPAGSTNYRRRSSVRFNPGGESPSATTTRNQQHLRPSTTAFHTRRERNMMFSDNSDGVDYSHIGQQTHPIRLKTKQQLNPVLPEGFVPTKDLSSSLSELKRFYKKSANTGTNHSTAAAASNQQQDTRNRIYESLQLIQDRFSDESIHPQVKARHMEDLFQITHFLLKDQAQLASKYQDLERDNQLLKQEVRQYEDRHKSDLDLVVPNPSQDDFRKLKKSVQDLRKEIADYSQTHMQELLNDGNSHSSQKEPGLESLQSHPFVSLLQQKFELLEDFVVRLKKKVHSLEQADEDVKKLGQEFGSVDTLLRENEKLRQDSHVLEWSKKRFDVDYLLRVEHTHSKDPVYLRTLAFALQRELAQCREALQYFNYESNSQLKLGVTVQNGPLTYSHRDHQEFADLNQLMKELFVQEDEEPAAFKSKKSSRSFAPAPRNEQQNPDSLAQKRKIETLTQENRLLHEQVKRHTSELKETKNLLSLLESQYKHQSNSRFELKEIEVTARRMMEQLTQLNKQTTDRENAYIFQQNLVEKMNQQQTHLESQIASLSEKLLTSHVKQKDYRSKLQAAKNAIQTLHTISISLIHLYMEDESRRKHLFGSSATDASSFNHVSSEQMISFLYRDLYHVYTQSTEAAVRIQSLWRGVQTRRQLLKQGFYNIIIKKPKHDTLDPHIKQQVKMDASVPNSREQLSLRHTVATGNLKRTVETIGQLQHLLMIQYADTEQLKQLKNQLAIIKGSLLNEFKEQVQVQLDAFREHMNQIGTDMTSNIHRLTTVPQHTRSIQTTSVEQKNKPTQVGAAQFSSLKVVQSFHERMSGQSADSKKGKKK